MKGDSFKGDAWSWILDHLSRALDTLAPATGADTLEAELLRDCEAIVGAIGKRLGELHAIFSRGPLIRHSRLKSLTQATPRIGRGRPKSEFKRPSKGYLGCRLGNATRIAIVRKHC